jgi:hypothetical protein
MLFRRKVTGTTAKDPHEYRQQQNRENYLKDILWEVKKCGEAVWNDNPSK